MTELVNLALFTLVFVFLLAALIAILVVPFIVVVNVLRFLLRRIPPGRGRWLLAALFFGPPLAGLIYLGAIGYAQGRIGSSPARVARDHSVTLPASAAHISCELPICITTFGDFGAFSTFDLARADLPALVDQLFSRRDATADQDSTSREPGVPRRFGPLEASFSGMSHDGNRTTLHVYSLTSDRVGISIGTIWN